MTRTLKQATFVEKSRRHANMRAILILAALAFVLVVGVQPGTMRAIIRDTGLTVEEFMKLL
ncbi:hypothetical protein A3K71_04845 [archaeon RBG_16_50_20]|nr:MAG: hypothetical protein A3K71_04845 [archaeon RBG_16_50_20]